MFAFTSKYALALYEMGEKRRNMQFRWTETFELNELRELLGVKPGELTTFGNLNAWCLKPAAQEVNGLADFGVAFRPEPEALPGRFTQYKSITHRGQQINNSLQRHRIA